MKLDSARSLKASLMGQDLWKGVAAPVMAAAFTETVRSVRAARAASTRKAPTRAPLAMGVRGGKHGYCLAVRVQEMTAGIAQVLDHITKCAKGEVDVRIVGNVRKQAKWHRKRNRPLRIGGSIGHRKITAGTLGCFVTPRNSSNEDWILSNNHVLANENDAKRGDKIVQPGPEDGGRVTKDLVGHLKKFVRLKKNDNTVDAAVASLADDIEYHYNWLETKGALRGVRRDPIDEGHVVYKVGRTTGVTKGRVSAIEIDALQVEYDADEWLTFNGQIEIEPVGNKPFSLGGDSGSLIFDARRRAVALLFAGNDVDATYASPIETVLDALKVDLVF